MNAGESARRPSLLTALLVAAGVLAVSIGITVRLADLHLQTVLSNSMRPTVSAGDVAVTRAIPIESLRAGDVIAFVPPNSTQPVLHRITSLGGGVITTRGDANTVDDPWRLTLRGTTAYRLVAVVPSLGWLTGLRQPALLIAGLLVGLAIVIEVGKEVRTRATRSRPQPGR